MDEKTVPFLSQKPCDSSKNSNQKSTIDTPSKKSPNKKTQIDTLSPSNQKPIIIDTTPEKSPNKKTQIDTLSPANQKPIIIDIIPEKSPNKKIQIDTLSPSYQKPIIIDTIPEKSPNKKTQIDTLSPSYQKPMIIDTYTKKSPSKKIQIDILPSKNFNVNPKYFTYSPPAKISPNMEKSPAQTQHDMKESLQKIVEEMSAEIKRCTMSLRELNQDKKESEFNIDFTSWNVALVNLRNEIMEEIAIVRKIQFETRQNINHLQNQLQKINSNLSEFKNELKNEREISEKIKFV